MASLERLWLEGDCRYALGVVRTGSHWFSKKYAIATPYCDQPYPTQQCVKE